jgi:hypothetical protein
MSAPREISDLVDRFAEHAEAYRSGAYNETQLRREFVDPMFKALGWDMDNLSGYAEATRMSSTKTPSRSAARRKRPTIASASVERGSFSSKRRSLP